MDSPNEAIYRGSIQITGANGFCRSFYDRLNLGKGSHPLEVRFWQSKDRGEEMLSIFVEGRPIARWVTKDNSVTMILKEGKELNIFERNAPSGAVDSGFYLPRTQSKLFLVKLSPTERSWGDLCAGKGDDCETSTLGFLSGMSPVTLTERGNHITVPGPKGPHYDVQLKGNQEGFPTLITFQDSPNRERRVATSGEFRLVSVTRSTRQAVHPREFAQEGAVMNITRGTETIGGAYLPGLQDPWKFYDAQVTFHRKLETRDAKANSTQFVLVGAGLLLTAIMFGLIALLPRKPGTQS